MIAVYLDLNNLKMIKLNLPPYPTFPRISDERMTLKEVENEELPALISISYYDGVQADGLETAQAMQTKIDADYNAGNSIHWCIVDNHSKEVVGTCGYYRGFSNGSGELGCVLLPAFYGKGYMSAALALAIQVGIKTVGLNRITAITSQDNKKAIQLLLRLQFVKTTDLNDNQMQFIIPLTDTRE